MKQILYFILLFVVFACEERVEPNFSNHSLNLHLSIPQEAQELIGDTVPIAVNFTNNNKNYSFTAYSDSSNELQYKDLESGIYTLNISQEFERGIFKVVLNSSSELTITEDNTDTLELNAVFIQTNGGGFIIKEQYYSGSRTPAGKSYYHDQFIEIYNNCPDTLYADGLAIVELESIGNSENYFKYMQADSIVAKTIFQVPGQGEDYPIAPGTGFLIAEDGLNHQSDPNGNPDSPVNLGDAEFEFFSDKSPGADIDYPAENMIESLWVFKGNDMLFFVSGGSAIALVKIEGGVNQYIEDNYVTKGSPTSTSKYYCKIPNEWVIDAVEVTQNDKLNKRLDNSLDAGSVTIAAGTFSGLGIRRKIEKVINGRTIYKDTNNSSEDFDHDVIPNPRWYE